MLQFWWDLQICLAGHMQAAGCCSVLKVNKQGRRSRTACTGCETTSFPSGDPYLLQRCLCVHRGPSRNRSGTHGNVERLSYRFWGGHAEVTRRGALRVPWLMLKTRVCATSAQTVPANSHFEYGSTGPSGNSGVGSQVKNPLCCRHMASPHPGSWRMARYWNSFRVASSGICPPTAKKVPFRSPGGGLSSEPALVSLMLRGIAGLKQSGQDAAVSRTHHAVGKLTFQV